MSEQRAWDVVVVGAGSSGAGLAARLSEDPARQVQLLEAGRTTDRPTRRPRCTPMTSSRSSTSPASPNTGGSGSRPG